MAMVGFLGLGIQICFTGIVHLVYSLGESIFPSLVEFHVTDDVRFKKSLEANWKYTNLILFPLICGLFILAKPMVTIIIGEEYLPSAGIINLLLPATVFMVWAHVYRQILFIFERKVTIFLARLAGFIAFLSSIFFFMKNWGIAGASLSVSFGTLMAFICMYFGASKIEKIPSELPHVFRPLLSSAIMAIIISYINVSNPVTLLGTILLGMVVYFSVMLLIKGITKIDIQRAKSVFQQVDARIQVDQQ
jgi:O-antigen/teichoic acid export membrane protein